MWMFTIEFTETLNSPVFDRVMSLRERIYGEEFGFPNELLKDAYDDYSTHFLFTVHGQDVGTLRLTHGNRGVLEVELQNPEWSATVSGCRGRGEAVCEYTRLMLVPAARGGEGLVRLLLAAGRRALELGHDRLFAAGKEGALERLYRMMGAQVHDPEYRGYQIGGHVLGQYNLLSIVRQDADANIARLTRRFTRPGQMSFGGLIPATDRRVSASRGVG
jgi:hypothetical protein